MHMRLLMDGRIVSERDDARLSVTEEKDVYI